MSYCFVVLFVCGGFFFGVGCVWGFLLMLKVEMFGRVALGESV